MKGHTLKTVSSLERKLNFMGTICHFCQKFDIKWPVSDIAVVIVKFN